MKKNEIRYLAPKVLSFAALLALQTLPSSLHAQAANAEKQTSQTTRAAKSNIYLKINGLKQTDEMKLVGATETACVFENSKGEFFMVDAATGDMKPVSTSYHSNMKTAEIKYRKIIFPLSSASKSSNPQDPYYKIKFAETLKVMGIDKDKHVIMQTAAGENIYLDPSTGDMVNCATGKHFSSEIETK